MTGIRTIGDDGLYPAVEPYREGSLDVGDGNLVHWEESGSPGGRPALVVHGGPGSGSSPRARRHFDPSAYRIIQFDQRGCGRSTPHAADPATDMAANTTEHLLADMERLRTELGVERWVLYGGSWGSTLLLAYAQRHPERVEAVVVAGVTTTRRAEIDWLYRGVGRFFPEEWERFRAAVPEARGPRDLVAAYARRMESADPAVRERAALDWCRWEDAVLSLEPHGAPDLYGGRPDAARIALVRIAAHYFAQGAWLDEGALLDGAGRLEGIPGVLFHGRLDLSSPLDTAWHLARRWAGAELVVVDDAGHKGSDELRRGVRAALDRFR
ncbi:prolyl aminopeptidase [Streptomyces sp. NPDC090026]|uniref:prolyl aminopeptidase n=1 Tax=Streptomyces sp. NPDC090026 TaxID=3365923 RepID=UPI00381682AA